MIAHCCDTLNMDEYEEMEVHHIFLISFYMKHKTHKKVNPFNDEHFM